MDPPPPPLSTFHTSSAYSSFINGPSQAISTGGAGAGGNSSSNGDLGPLPSLADVSNGELVFRILGAVFCTAIILCTLLGNVLVIIVVFRFHRMRTVTNILLASLAIADITVACLVMSFTVVYDILRYWPWGSILCHFWISCDVMCCTASILHLCAVAIDRFWAITRPLRYRTYISKRRLFIAIIVIWFASAAISFIPIFSGWYHADGPINVFTLKNSPDCGLDVNRIYAVVSSLTSFYLPLPVMFYVYFRILLVAERQSREIKQLEMSLAQNGLLSVNYTPSSNINHHSHHHGHGHNNNNNNNNTSASTAPAPAQHNNKNLAASNGNGNGHHHGPPGSPKIHHHNHHSIQFSSLINIETGESGHLNGSPSIDAVSLGGSSDHSSVVENKRHVERSLRRRTRQLITDTKAIRTLGIVMGVFCLSWLPFFIFYVVSAFCVNCNISYEVKSGITWLGYINSALNPAIYAYLNKEFKTAFKRVLCCLPRSAMGGGDGLGLGDRAGDRDAMLDEISTTSRSYQRGSGCGGVNLHGGFGGTSFVGSGVGSGGVGGVGGGSSAHGHGSLDVPPTPGFMSRTPSATPETTHWPIVQTPGALGQPHHHHHHHSLLLESRNASLSTTNAEEQMTTSIVIPVKIITSGGGQSKPQQKGKNKKSKGSRR